MLSTCSTECCAAAAAAAACLFCQQSCQIMVYFPEQQGKNTYFLHPETGSDLATQWFPRFPVPRWTFLFELLMNIILILGF